MQRAGKGWWATGPREPSCQGVCELELGAPHCAKAQGTERACRGRTCGFLTEVLGDRDERPVRALLPGGRTLSRPLSEPGESLDEGLDGRFAATGWEVRERRRAPLATQRQLPSRPGLPGCDVLFQGLKG